MASYMTKDAADKIQLKSTIWRDRESSEISAQIFKGGVGISDLSENAEHYMMQKAQRGIMGIA